MTLLFGVTTMYLSLLHSPTWAGADLSSLRTLICGGSPVPETLLRQYAERGLTISQGYGLTETSPGATFLRAVDGMRKLGSAGTAHFWSDVRLVDSEFRDTATGETGEVLVQGPNVTPGYWQNAGATQDAFLMTVGESVPATWPRRTRDGFVYIVDRLKDMIISGGENVYPAEVEAAIYEHPGVAECAVVGVPDPKWGEVGRAVVVAKAGHDVTEEADPRGPGPEPGAVQNPQERALRPGAAPQRIRQAAEARRQGRLRRRMSQTNPPLFARFRA